MDPEEARVFGDLIKVGIPSVIAFAGVVSSFLLALKGHKKDIQIEALRSAQEAKRYKVERQGELIRDVTAKTTRMHDALVKYGTMYSAYIETQDMGEKFPAKGRQDLSALYQSITELLHLGSEVQAAVYLLGDEALKRICAKYIASLSGFCQSYSPSTYGKYSDIMRELIRIGEEQEALFARLSKIFLLENE